MHFIKLVLSWCTEMMLICHNLFPFKKVFDMANCWVLFTSFNTIFINICQFWVKIIVIFDGKKHSFLFLKFFSNQVLFVLLLMGSSIFHTQIIVNYEFLRLLPFIILLFSVFLPLNSTNFTSSLWSLHFKLLFILRTWFFLCHSLKYYQTKISASYFFKMSDYNYMNGK